MNTPRNWDARAVLRLLVMSFACGGSGPGTDSDATEGILSPGSSGSGPSSSGTSSGASSGSSSSGTTDEPNYPAPSPATESGTCPEGFFGPITFDMVGWVCLPACDPDAASQCPQPTTGTAEARCSTNPWSSGAACTEDEDCSIEDEQCGRVGVDPMGGCLLEPSHCLLWCDGGEACPDSMVCTEPLGVCQYT